MICIASKSRADYFKARRENQKTFSVALDRQKLELFEIKLQEKKQTKTEWLNEKIDEELKNRVTRHLRKLRITLLVLEWYPVNLLYWIPSENSTYFQKVIFMTYNDLIRFMIDQIHDENILKEIYSIVRYISYNKEAKTP